MGKSSRKQRKKQDAPQVVAPVAVASVPVDEWAIASWLRSHSFAICVALVAIATLRIVATYHVFDHTSDEPMHVACGMELLVRGEYQLEAQHPPLTRLAVALGPYLAGARSPLLLRDDYLSYRVNMPLLGAAILNSDHAYDRNLTLARLGILPFFWIASLVVFFWARHAAGDLAAVFAVFLFTFLPPVLAHAGLATTDMALTAFVGAALFTALLWAEKPTFRRSLLFGAAVGMAVLSKFSSLPFLPAAMAAAIVWYLAAERPGWQKFLADARARLQPFGLAVLTGALVIWAGYAFTFGPVPNWNVSLPAPQLFTGIQEVTAHNAMGHQSYLLGMLRTSGWWYFFPVVLAVKTPLPFLALLLVGVALCFRSPRTAPRGLAIPLVFSLGILIFSMSSRINIGLRHILPVYIGFSIVAAIAAVQLLDRARSSRWIGYALIGLAVWSGATSLVSHPDYLPYFNALAFGSPEKIVVDSDLDWGQDMKRLGTRLREVGARELSFVPAVETATRGYPPIHYGYRQVPSPGWNAVSMTVWKAQRLGLGGEHPEVVLWPDKFPPTERIGKGILLYYFPPH